MGENLTDKPIKDQPSGVVAQAPRRRRFSLTRMVSRRNRRLLTYTILILAIAAAVVFGLKYKDVQDRLNNPTAAVQAETAGVVKKVGKLYLLPQDETPTLFKVTDVSKRTEAFFKDAQNGDQGLIYTKAKLVILYRPSINKVVNAAPLNLSENQISP